MRKYDAFEVAICATIAQLKLELNACNEELLTYDLNKHFDLYVRDLLATVEIPDQIAKMERVLAEWRWNIYGETSTDND